MTRRVLAAEDSLVQRERLRADLAAAGFEVVTASDGQEALEHLDAGAFDLLVTDVVMPGMDGYELCRRAKERDEQLPVVLLTSLTDPTEIVRGLEAGADTFLRKPYDPDRLAARLRAVLGRRRTRFRGAPDAEPDIALGDQRFPVTAGRQQILDLLVASFEDLLDTNVQLYRREAELTATRDELHRQLDHTEQQRSYLEAVLSASPQALLITDERLIITSVNNRLTTLLHTDGDALVGRSVFEVLRLVDSSGHPIPTHERPVARALGESDGEALETGARFDVLLDTPDGPVPVIVRAAAVRDSSGQVVAAVDVVQEIAALAAHDPVTKLPKHGAFIQRVAHAGQLSAERGRTCGVLAAVVDPLARLRAQLSHTVVDRILAELASRLRDLLAVGPLAERTTMPSAAYFGESMFGLVLPCLDEEVDGVRIAHLVAERLTGPVVPDDVAFDLTVTVAATFGRRGTPDALGLVTAAATAARKASEAGGDTVEVVDPAVGARADDRLRREAELRQAISTGGLEVHYQPQLDAGDQTPVAGEALVRWRHAVHGLLSPAEFIPLAEETGLVIPLGWWVLREACRQAAEWRHTLPHGETLKVSVNLSASQLAMATAAERVNDVLAETGLTPSALVLEVTEGEYLSDSFSASERLHALAALGTRIAIDDFGTGYSSLLQLRRFPVHALKIDRGFVSGMTEDLEDAAIVSASVRLAHALGLEVVAEGVETSEQLAQLQVLQCQLAQGYLWSPPLPPAKLERWWAAAGAR